MTRLKVEIKSGSAAFMDGNAAAEVARILRELADRIENTEHGTRRRVPVRLQRQRLRSLVSWDRA